MVEIIKKKRAGFALNKSEINTIINGFVSGEIPDYQISAWLMAVCFQGLNDEETADLTDAMMRSGELIDLSSIKGIKVDKHSTGGVGDKTTLVLGPLVAAAGVPVAKMSGRGLGHTGGTLDKFESIPGFNVNLSKEEFIEKVKKHGIAICSQNDKLVPADKKLYALRDVTGTVDNISLISSSVMSKKLACGADAIVIDIKVGDGAFMKTVEDAHKLAELMIATAKKMGRKLIAVITGMEEPLGFAVGNALEVKESIETLKGHGPEDLTNLCLELGSHMLMLADIVDDHASGIQLLKKTMQEGKAYEKFKELVSSQGGDIRCVDDPTLMTNAPHSYPYKSKYKGYIGHLSALDIGLASVKLGAGRETKDSIIDKSAGIILNKKVGDFVNEGDVLATLYASNKSFFANAAEYMDIAYTFKETKPEKQKLIFQVVS